MESLNEKFRTYYPRSLLLLREKHRTVPFSSGGNSGWAVSRGPCRRFAGDELHGPRPFSERLRGNGICRTRRAERPHRKNGKTSQGWPYRSEERRVGKECR